MSTSRGRIGLRGLLALVALSAVLMSVVSREAKRRRGWIVPGDVLIVEVLEGPARTPDYRATSRTLRWDRRPGILRYSVSREHDNLPM